MFFVTNCFDIFSSALFWPVNFFASPRRFSELDRKSTLLTAHTRCWCWIGCCGVNSNCMPHEDVNAEILTRSSMLAALCVTRSPGCLILSETSAGHDQCIAFTPKSCPAWFYLFAFLSCLCRATEVFWLGGRVRVFLTACQAEPCQWDAGRALTQFSALLAHLIFISFSSLPSIPFPPHPFCFVPPLPLSRLFPSCPSCYSSFSSPFLFWIRR